MFLIKRISLVLWIALVVGMFQVQAQPNEQPNSAEIYHQLKRLNKLGKVLYIAAHPDGDGVHPMSAQVAAKAGRGVAVNALQSLRGRRLSELSLTDLGWVVDLSGWQGVADIIGLPLASPVLDRIVPFLHDAIDLRSLVQIGGLGGMFSQPENSSAMSSSTTA